MSVGLFLGVSFSAFAEGSITGYYYDPATGKIILKVDNLSPSASQAYLNSEGSTDNDDSGGKAQDNPSWGQGGNPNNPGHGAEVPGQTKEKDKGNTGQDKE